ncbi:MAG: hypothetical protein P4M14_01965 [Gammaproteobacteria bacterium]|nr:hypothetical protein [Gammaproteobacteria bacterium]
MKRILTFIITIVTPFIIQASFAKSGLLFNVTANGLPAKLNITLCLNGNGSLSCQTYTVSASTLSIKTTIPNHTYPAIGIKVNTPGYTPAGCTPIPNGYCLFSASDTTPSSLTINPNSMLNYWVATNGNDAASGDYNHPFLTIQQAQNTVRNNPLRGKYTIIVNIRGGLYRLNNTLTLNQSDSGSRSGSVIYRAAPGESPVISGGKQITGWTLHDPVLNIWQAQTTVSTFTMPRQLYVNGVRATRARTQAFPNYYTPTSTGYTYSYTSGSDPQYPPTWAHPTDVEFVTATQWKMMRCSVAGVNNNDVVMQTPCWTNANTYPLPWNFYLLSWLENAYEFLNTPGYWYLGSTSNSTAKIIYYIPRSGEDLTTADVELPVLQTLIQGSGDQTTPIQYLSFEGLSFQYATWLDINSTTNSSPSSSSGYVCDQSGFHLLGTNHSATLNIIGHDQNVTRTPGNVSFIYAQHITFANNTFQHLGAIGLDFDTGSEFNQIVNNIFNDISGAGIQIGGVSPQDHHPVGSQLTTDNLISNNLVQYIGQEFYDAPGIYVGVTTHTVVEHNDIQNVPWAGIAIGWGWGLLDPDGFPGLPHATQYMWGVYSTPSAAHRNQIRHNNIQNFLEQLWDGGAIYSTGYQGTSITDGQVISYNVAQNKRVAAGGNTFYTDGGSRFITLNDNVSLNNPSGFFDYGPCNKSDSFPAVPPSPELCLLNSLNYGTDMGGCIPYGDLNFTNNYLGDIIIFYNPCIIFNPDYPVRLSLNNNIQVSSSSQVPASILNAAGRQ